MRPQCIKHINASNCKEINRFYSVYTYKERFKYGSLFMLLDTLWIFPYIVYVMKDTVKQNVTSRYFIMVKIGRILDRTELLKLNSFFRLKSHLLTVVVFFTFKSITTNSNVLKIYLSYLKLKNILFL